MRTHRGNHENQSSGGSALPLEPPELVADWHEHIETMRQRSGAENNAKKGAV
jgi:hypothetical protein